MRLNMRPSKSDQRILCGKGAEHDLVSGESKDAHQRFQKLRPLNQRSIGIDVLKEKSIKEREIPTVVEEEGYCWMMLLLKYLTNDMLPAETKNWVEEVPHVLWAYRTTIKTSNGYTPFSLTYDTEAVILVEIGKPSLRCVKIDQAINDEALLLNLDILEDEREKAVIQEAKSKAKMEKYYNAKVHNTTFKPWDFVYRSNEASHAKDGGKLGLKWEGPYEVVEALGKGAYKIRSSSGDILPQTWNIKDLKKCYL
ncbi:reverse transcriptase domain-containing protein [Tanacetum coccineum]